MKKIKNFVITFGFVTILMIVCIVNISIKDKDISFTERRRLAQFPKINSEKLVNGELVTEFEKYTTDQFEFRDNFRRIKSYFSTKVLLNKDDKKMFEYDNALYKIEYPLNQKNVENNIKKINKICEEYLQGFNVFYLIIPDKNYYLPENEHLKFDYNELKQIVDNNIKHAKSIDIWSELDINDYYRTDIHWKQENLEKVANKIKKDIKLDVNSNYDVVELGDFYGSYYGQLGKRISPDKIKILNNEVISKSQTYNFETNVQNYVYDIEKYKKSADRYDVYLSGPTSLMSIENIDAKTDKELLIFRDSFGSSITPLLIDNYKKITLIDLRYIDSSLLKKYIRFDNQDVIFMYSTLILNQDLLKVNL